MLHLLPLFLVPLAAYAVPQTSKHSPICIVGAGPSGLTVAHELEAKGHNVVIFESQREVGGKSQAVYDEHGLFHPLGALLFVNETYRDTLPLIDAAGVPIFPSIDPTFQYNFVNGSVGPFPQPSPPIQALILSELGRYALFHNETFARFQALRYTNGIPDEFTQPIGSWLTSNGYRALQSVMASGMTAYGYGSIEQTPAVYIFQYLTPAILSAFIGIEQGYIVDFHKVLVEYSRSIKGKIHTNTAVTSIKRSGPKPVITYRSNGRKSSQACASVVLAFPPLQGALSAAGVQLFHEETAVFSKVRMTEYWSGAVHTTQIPPRQLYLQEPPSAQGEPVGFWRLFEESNITTTYSWGPYRGNVTTEQAKASLISTLSPLNFDPATQSPNQSVPVLQSDVVDFRKWDYFPHFDEEDLKDDIYKRFNALQGKQNTYYCSGLNGFETVEFAIRAAKDLVSSFF